MTRVLGIAGSPRKNGNTEYLVRLALEAASGLPGVESRFINLRELDIRPCTGCLRCSVEKSSALPCPQFEDDLPYQAMLEADGIILGTPVYFGTVSWLMKVFMDRCEPFFRKTRRPALKAGLRCKVGGGLVVGHSRQGGQEYTIAAIHNFFLIQEMIVVGAMSEDSTVFAGPSFGAAGVQYPHDDTDSVAIRNDQIATASSRRLGITVAQVAAQLKAGRTASETSQGS
jgi:multimeric flavodoxin WrbA